MLKVLAMAVAMANARLQEKIIANPAVEGMGTTLTALLWSDGHAAVCHIGDSRGYLLREGELYQITHDHTLVQSLVDEGRISADDVSTHPQRSLLLRALDGRSVAEPDLSVHESLPGDRYLLCSDGLSGVVSDETLRDTLSSFEDPETAARQLIDLAIHGGGPDNITCIVADVVDTATTRLPLTTTPVLAGAAASLGDLRLADGTGPFGIFEDHPRGPRARRADRTAAGRGRPGPDDDRRGHSGAGERERRRPAGYGGPAQPPRAAAAIPGLAAAPPPLADRDDRAGGAGRGGHRRRLHLLPGEPGPVLRRGQRSGQVVIYRGISQHIPGISLSSPHTRDRDPAVPGAVELPADGEDRLQHGQPDPGPPTVTNIRAAVESAAATRTLRCKAGRPR